MGGEHHRSHALRPQARVHPLSPSNEVSTKLGAARTRLILEKPFIGALVMHLPLQAADTSWCETVATDARALYFNPGYIAGLTLAQTQFVLAHEAMHCALAHFARRQHRLRQRWDIACDHAVNLLLVDEGLQPPPGALADPRFRGLSAEEIYPLIPPDAREQTLDRHLFDGASSDAKSAGAKAGRGGATRGGRMQQAEKSPEAEVTPTGEYWDDAGNERRRDETRTALRLSEPGPAEREELTRRWQARMAAAAQQARQAGRLTESWLRVIDGLIQPQLPWRFLLARYLMSIARDDYSFQRAARRESAALLPRLASAGVDLYVVLDTSGSIGNEELAQFATEVDALKGQIRARVTVHACDERLDARGPWQFEPWQPVELPKKIGGGGGTSFVPVFDWIAAERRRPDLLLYFSDAEGTFPVQAPDYPVVWLVKGRGKVPWGERIQLN
jgi:predicted metal-dependent peptidase